MLWQDVNDTDEDARRLAALLAGLPAHVNLIPHNAFEGNSLRAPADERVLAFQARVQETGLRCLVRWPRGPRGRGGLRPARPARLTAVGQLRRTDVYLRTSSFPTTGFPKADPQEAPRCGADDVSSRRSPPCPWSEASPVRPRPRRRRRRRGRKGRDYFAELGVRPFINAAGTYTAMTASLMPPEVMEAIQYASKRFVMLDELHDKVGQRIATLLRAEGAMVTSGAASALTLGTAAVLTGKDQQKMVDLPNLAGMKSEVIIQKAHRFGYDHAVRNCGVTAGRGRDPGRRSSARSTTRPR